MPRPITTKADLDAMIRVAQEGYRMEFKEDLKVHKQKMDEEIKKGVSRPKDTWWQTRKSVGDTARDEILEEIVAFANAQGGTLILGIEEDADTMIAKAICSLPEAVALAEKFKAFIMEHIEPRLGYCRVQAISTEPDGSGVVVFDIEPSRMGPHRVKSTMRTTIRRDDKCMPLSMMEVQDMTLRNARRFDEVRSTIDARLGALTSEFTEFLLPKVAGNAIGGSDEQRVASSLKHSSRGAYAFRVLIVAHEDLGIDRLREFNPLIPPQTCVSVLDRPTENRLFTTWPYGGVQRRFLGGVENEQDFGLGKIIYRANREGVVEATLLMVGVEGEHTCFGKLALTGIMACCFGIYDNLRERSGRTNTPGEIAVMIRTIGAVHATDADGQKAAIQGGRLPTVSSFPRRSGADATEFSSILTETAQDLLDAANSSVGQSFGQTQFQYFSKAPS